MELPSNKMGLVYKGIKNYLQKMQGNSNRTGGEINLNRAQKRDEFIENLEKFRNAQGLSGVDFAKILKVKQSQWDRWKQAKVGITLKNTRRIVGNLNAHYGYKWKLADWVGPTRNLMSNVYKEGV